MTHQQTQYLSFHHQSPVLSPSVSKRPHHRNSALTAKQYQNSISKVRQKRHSKRTIMNPEELEAFQNASDKYYITGADLPGPLISSKLPMNCLVTEYAHADPRFVAKTTALAQTHSYYRAVKGDGQCGWRATVFGYFEILLMSGDVGLVQQETVRLRSFEDTMKMVGIEYDLMVDMFDTTWELLQAIQRAVENGVKDENVVLEYMNDENQSNSIVYHFKMMTSAGMQRDETVYEPFLEISVQEYRQLRIDPTNQEIDQIGLQALTNAVIAPSGLGLEVLYLDRSMGDEVTPHIFSTGRLGCTLSLLYRPGHYDIIYKGQMQPLQVFLQPHQHIPGSSSPSIQQESWRDHAAYITGADIYGGFTQADPWSIVAGHNQLQHSAQQFVPAPTSPTSPVFSNPWSLATSPEPHMMQYGAIDAAYTAQPPPTSIMSTTAQPMRSRPSRSAQSQSSASTVVSTPSVSQASAQNEPQIRMTRQMYEMGRHQSVSFDRQQGSSSAQETANHFLNNDFQPQMWKPDED